VSGTGSGAEAGYTGRNETEEEKADRKWGELIQEVRVAQTGVQILFAFLLTVVFTPKYEDLPHTDKVIYIVTVVLAAAATGALIGPVSLHRLVVGRRVKPQAVEWASRLTFVGLLLLLATMTAALLLILRVATDDAYVPWLVTGVLVWYVLCWFVVPILTRRGRTSK
jgi:magnesium-transporting ATPase (P-type)